MRLGYRKCLRPKCSVVETMIHIVEYWPSGLSFARGWRKATGDDIFQFNYAAEKPAIMAMITRKGSNLHGLDLYELRKIVRIGATYGVHACLVDVEIDRLNDFEEFCKKESLFYRYEPMILQEIY